jgi:hypothetical protein
MMKIYSTLMHLYHLGEKDGLDCGRRDGACQQLGKLLLRHARRRFGPPTTVQSAQVDTLIQKSALRSLEEGRDRLLGVTDWDELLAGVAVPAERPADPLYLVPFEFDPEPMPPSIDEFARVTTPAGPAIIHIRLQRLYQENLGAILHKEAQRKQAEHHCPVQTVVLLMWPGADGPAMTGEYDLPTGGTFHYHLTRLWEKDPDEMLQSISTACYAPLGKFPPERLREIVRRMEEVLDTKTRNEEERGKVWVVAYGSMGLRYSAEQVNALLAHKMPYIYQRDECRSMISEGYYAGFSQGLEEGALQAARQWVLTLGGQRLGAAPTEVPQGLAQIRHLDRLEQLASRALKGATWTEVLAPG